ncbi:MAG: gamma-glutamyl-gamma-aminobutyrate hydrolase family protein [Thermoflexales bacterium]|nr:gamma-glutamyl-gamma-aminobutyrate hydrolase family protein [Thermoflexales bacterium]MDW8351308.1 gamma-glutamyl-gamma-aminobutyrate hydrolase family protein [Anaerolineae bacterium]
MDRPRILIPIPIQDPEQRRFTLGKNYVNSLVMCGAIPILLPTSVAPEAWRAVYESADGVMLSGGGDVDPALFGEEAHQETYGVDRERDDMEIALARWALQDDKPLFAICRGIQVMNVAFGGSLIQDLPSQLKSDIPHDGNYNGFERHAVAHAVRIEPGTHISRIMGAGEVGVNSFHHQALKDVADGLVVTSRAPDGVIESVEFPGKRYYIGVQWHPEEMADRRDDMLSLFRTFVEACTTPRDAH